MEPTARLVIAIIALIIGLVVVSRFVGEATVRLILQIILAGALVYLILRFAGVL